MMTFSRKYADLKLFYSLHAIRKNLKHDRSQKSRKVFLLEIVILNLCVVSLKYLNASFLIMQTRQTMKSKINTVSYSFFISLVCKCPAASFFKSFLVTKLHFADLKLAPLLCANSAGMGIKQ